MPRLDNPAARLHALLTGLQETAAGASLQDCWSAVLDVPLHELWVHLSRVAGLISDTMEAVQATGESNYIDSATQALPAWAASVFPPSTALGSPRGAIPDDQSVRTLGLIAGYLSVVAPEGRVPAKDEVDRLIEGVRGVTNDVTQAEDLPADVQRLILEHLRMVESALVELRIAGPAGVQTAVEALLGAVVLKSDFGKTKTTATWKRVAKAVGLVWFAFTTPGQVPDALEAWNAVGELTSSWVSSEHADQGGADGSGEIVDAEVVDSGPDPAQR
jgi:hypothetical protein